MQPIFTYRSTQHLLCSVLGVSLVIALLLPHSVAAFFSDTELGGGERFLATELLLLPVADASATVTGTETPGEFTANLLLTNDSTAADYDVAVQQTNGSQAFCDALALQATSTEATINSQPLNDFASTPTSLTGVWSFAATMETVPLGLSEGATCSADLLVTAWQENMSKAAPGYFDTTTFTVQFSYQAAVEEPPEEPPVEPPVDPGAQLGDVVINEIMWMGSDTNERDEWIELRNTTNEDIAIGQWQIENGEANNQSINIPANSVIPANSLFLITVKNVSSGQSAVDNGPNNDPNLPPNQLKQHGALDLNDVYNTNGSLVLRSNTGTLIDQTPTATDGTWPHGAYTADDQYWSMQRGATPGDGLDVNNWYTCTPEVLQGDNTYTLMLSYWKSNVAEVHCGTPGHANLSSNDPTKPGYADWLADQSTAETTTAHEATEETTPDGTPEEDTPTDEATDSEPKKETNPERSAEENSPEQAPEQLPEETLPETTTPPTSTNTKEDGAEEDTDSAPIPDPDPVVKRSEEESNKDEDQAPAEETTEPEKSNDDPEAGSSDDENKKADDTASEPDPDPTDDTGVDAEEPVVEESGSTPNEDNA